MLDAINSTHSRSKSGSLIEVGNTYIGGTQTVIIAGPCSIESKEQIESAAKSVREQGATILRGGAYKPRTSPRSFQGLGEKGLQMLKDAGDKHGLPIISEVLSEDDVQRVSDTVDMIQIGARNMQNFALLKKVGKTRKPVLLKRGPAATIKEWISASEYIRDGGNEEIVLCERGIRSYDPYLRNTLDLGAVAWVKENTDFPVIVDPSHSTGIRALVTPAARAAVAIGADGIIVEVHPEPEKALSDAEQQLNFKDFGKLVSELRRPMPKIAQAYSTTASTSPA